MTNLNLTQTTIIKLEPKPRLEVIDASLQIKTHRQFRQLINFLSLIIGLSGAVGLFIWFWPDRLMLRLATLILAGFYVLWGTLTHLKTKSLDSRVFREYFSIAGLGALMLWLVI